MIFPFFILQVARVLLKKVSRFDNGCKTDTENQLALAQLYKIPVDEATTKKLDVLRKFGVDYHIPEQQFSNELEEDYSGYTCLHFAAKKVDSDLASELLALGADLFKQGLHDGYTALHVAVNQLHPISKHLHIYEMVGELRDNMLVNVLLSAHVKSQDAFNPTCFKNGISHLHIACIFNHTEAVKFFLKNGEPVNQVIDRNGTYLPGYTPLHCAVRYSSVEAVEILLKNGANVCLENAHGASVLDLIIHRSMCVTTLVMLNSPKLITLYNKMIEKIESMKKLIMQFTNITTRQNVHPSAFHIACTMRDNSLVENFLQQNVDVNEPVGANSEFWWKWTPLHFAAYFNIETFKLLLENGANIRTELEPRRSPLDFCLNRHNPEILNLAVHGQLKDIVLSDQRTKLFDLILILLDCEKLDNFLRNAEDVNISIPTDSPVWPGYTLLHLAVTMNKFIMFWDVIKEDSCFQEQAFYILELKDATEEEEETYKRRIDICLERGCDVSVKNLEGSTAIHLVYNFFAKDIVEKLLDYCKVDATGPKNLTLFHIACMMGKADLVKRMLNDGADVNKPMQRTGSREKEVRRTSIRFSDNGNATPLHLAVNREHRKIVKILLKNGANVHAEDEFGLTPIHYCFFLSEPSKTIGQLLLRRDPNLKDSVLKRFNLSYLHVAAYVDDAETVVELLQNNVDIDMPFRLDSKHPGMESRISFDPNIERFLNEMDQKTALHFAVEGDSRMAIQALLEYGADIHAEDSKGHSALQLAMRFYHSSTYFALKLKFDEANALTAIDNSGLTLLHVACASFDCEWAKDLLMNGANPNARMYNDLWFGATTLHVLVTKAKDGLIAPTSLANLAKLLIEYEADVTALDDDGFTALQLVAEAVFKNFHLDSTELFFDDVELDFWSPFADLLLKGQKSYHVNPVDRHGFSHFDYACMRNDVETVMDFLNCGVDVNSQMTNPFSNYAGFTPLHFAVAYGAVEVAYLLIERGADVGAEDANANTPLHVAIKRVFVNFRLIETLISHGADIDAKNLEGQTPLYCILRSTNLTLERLEFFLSRGCSINILNKASKKTMGIIGLAMGSSVVDDSKKIFKRLIGTPELQNAIESGFDFIHNVVSVSRFFLLPVDEYLEAIKELMKIGYDIDKQDAQGCTALHCAVTFRNYAAMVALLQLGADLNIQNHQNVTPYVEIIFEYLFQDEDDDVILINIIKTLARHVFKMKLGRIDVELTEDFSEGIEEEFPTNDEIRLILITELLKMEDIKFNDRFSLRNFMSELGAVAEYPRMSFIDREKVDKFFKSNSNIHQEFPEFGGLLMMQYRKALRRMEMWQPAKNALLQVCPDFLPDLCVELILRFFKTSELGFFIQSTREIMLGNLS